jgi:hypothetical protein
MGGFKESSTSYALSTTKPPIMAISVGQAFHGRIKEEKSIFYNHRLEKNPQSKKD